MIATRVLKLRTAEKIVDVPIHIFAPERAADGNWSCRYEVGWPDKKWEMAAWGTDSVQAIFLALQMIGSEIHSSSYHKVGALFLDKPGGGYGFPVPSSLRALLQGDDTLFL